MALRFVTAGWTRFIDRPYVVAHTHYSPVVARIVSSNCPVTSRIPRKRASECCAFTTSYDVATIPVGMIAQVDSVHFKREK